MAPLRHSSTTGTGTGFLAAAAIATTAASLVATATYALCRHRRRHRRIDASSSSTSSSSSSDESPRYPPTPPDRHWLFGHAGSVDLTKTDNHDLLFLNWMDELKSRVIMFNLPVVGRFIVVGDATVARYVLNGDFVKSPTYSTLKPLIGRRSLVTLEGMEWSAQRRSYNPGFSPDFLRDVVSTVISKCRSFVDACDMDAAYGRSTNMLVRAIDLTIDVIASVGFGEDWSASSDGRVSTMRRLTSLIGESMKDPLKRYFNPVHVWRTWRLSSILDRDMRDLVTRRLDELIREGTDAPPAGVASSSVDGSATTRRNDILSLTLSRFLKQRRHQRSSGGGDTTLSRLGPVDMEIITSQLKTFYFAGHDTTATTIAWAYWLLVRHPDCLRRARAEVEEHVGPNLLVDGTTYDALQKCAYLDAVSRETLRLYPPAATTRYVPPTSTSRDDDGGASVVPNAGGYLLGDSIVHLNFYAIQRDPDAWDGPNEFVPERFLGDDGRRRISSSSFLPFSRGARDCIGKYFALLEIKIALAALICRYDGDAIDADEVYVARLTSIPRGGCKVNLRRRTVT
jgi:cytochrome P450